MTYPRLDQEIVPTARSVRLWWHRLNRDAFGGRLPVPSRLGTHSARQARRWCGFDADGTYSTADSRGYGEITIWSRKMTRRHMLCTLIHEMIHQLQDLQGKPLVHGRYFKVMCKWYGRKVYLPVT